MRKLKTSMRLTIFERFISNQICIIKNKIYWFNLGSFHKLIINKFKESTKNSAIKIFHVHFESWDLLLTSISSLIIIRAILAGLSKQVEIRSRILTKHTFLVNKWKHRSLNRTVRRASLSLYLLNTLAKISVRSILLFYVRYLP